MFPRFGRLLHSKRCSRSPRQLHRENIAQVVCLSKMYLYHIICTIVNHARHVISWTSAFGVCFSVKRPMLRLRTRESHSTSNVSPDTSAPCGSALQQRIFPASTVNDHRSVTINPILPTSSDSRWILLLRSTRPTVMISMIRTSNYLSPSPPMTTSSLSRQSHRCHPSPHIAPSYLFHHRNCFGS
jgi:hypothetical protein